MILEATLPCSYLLLTCGSSIYILYKHSYYEHSKLLTHFIFAFIGFTALGIRSLHSLIFKLFFKSYTLDLAMIETEEVENGMKVNIFDQILNHMSRSSLICSLFFHHGHYFLGINTIANFFLCNLIHVKDLIASQDQNERIITFFYQRSLLIEVSELFMFLELLTTSFVMWLNNNNYGLVANLYYAVTTFSLPTEGFYQGWTIYRAINNYITMAYVILMTEALKQV